MSDNYSKSYTLLASDYEGNEAYYSARQINDVRQSAINAGYRPTGQTKLAEVTLAGESAILRFEVPVELAQGAAAVENDEQAYEVQHAKVSPKDQATFEAAIAADVDPDKADAFVSQADLSPEDAAKAVKSKARPEFKTGVAEQKAEPSTGSAQELGLEPQRAARGRSKRAENLPEDLAHERQGPGGPNADKANETQAELKGTDEDPSNK